jgi:ATP-dependent exoDNAse (exonuclease V) beta subunit
MTATMTEVFREYLENKAALEPGQVEAVMSDSPMIVVSAGAGTGKTLTLAWRFVRLVAVDRIPVDRILTITFTEKAAMEMRERIRRLMALLSSDMPEFCGAMEEALSRLDEAYVSTIHSFSMRVLRECGLSVDMDPNIRVISPPEENSFWQFLERAIDREDLDPLTESLDPIWRERGSNLLEENTTADIINTFGAINLSRAASSAIPLFESRNISPEDLWVWADNIVERDKALSRELLDSLVPLWTEAWKVWIEGILPDAGAPEIFKGDKAIFAGRALDFFKRWNTSPPGKEKLPAFALALMDKEKGLIGNLKGSTGKCMKQVKGSVLKITGEPLAEYRDSRLSWVSAAKWITWGSSPEETLLREKLLRLISLFWKYFESTKLSRGTISFEDMIRGARKAIVGEPSFAGKFRHVIVDEFQDTNSLQDELITSLSPSEGGSLFLVGDLQQSIYRFRHAQPEIFWKRINSPGGSGCRLIDLDVTFRCRQDVMDSINGLFGETWKDGIASSTGKKFSPLMPPESRQWWKQRQEISASPFEIIIASDPGSEKPARTPQLREAALRVLADKIVETVSTGATVWREDGAGTFSPGPAAYRDIAVLVPSRGYYGIIEKIFIEERGIPTYFERNRNYFERGEVKDAVSLLQAMADPSDSLALASFLSSPLSGLSPEHASELVSGSIGTNKPLIDWISEKSPDAAEWFDNCRKAGLASGPSVALALLLNESRVLASYPSWRRARVAANLRRAVDLAREYEGAMGRSLSGCAAYLGDVASRGIDSKEADILGEDDDMVRVMTVHSAKGLEFPVVAVTGLERGIRTRGQGTRIIPSAKLGVAATGIPEEWDYECKNDIFGGAIHDLFETREETEENERLLYVACTRARDSLILCGICPVSKGVPKPKDHSWLRTISSWLGGIEKLPLVRPDEVQPGKTGIRETPEAEQGGSVPAPELPEKPLERISATAYALFRFCPYAFRMRHRQGMDISWESHSGGDGGSDLGSLAHWILKRWDLRPETLPRFDPRVSLSLGSVLPPELRPVWANQSRSIPLIAQLEKFSASPTTERIRCAKDAMKEAPFRVRLKDGTLMVGAIDVVWKSEGRVFIRDYKTGMISGSAETLYDSQLLFYALAARKHFGDAPIDLALVSIEDPGETTIDTRDVSWPDMEDNIISTAKNAGSSPFSPNLAMCPSCPWRRNCSGIHLKP